MIAQSPTAFSMSFPAGLQARKSFMISIDFIDKFLRGFKVIVQTIIVLDVNILPDSTVQHRSEAPCIAFCCGSS